MLNPAIIPKPHPNLQDIDRDAQDLDLISQSATSNSLRFARILFTHMIPGTHVHLSPKNRKSEERGTTVVQRQVEHRVSIDETNPQTRKPGHNVHDTVHLFCKQALELRSSHQMFGSERWSLSLDGHNTHLARMEAEGELSRMRSRSVSTAPGSQQGEVSPTRRPLDSGLDGRT